MTGESVECFNCGRPNPAWAQVCRSCGVPLVAARGDGAPSGPFPTDQASLVSMGAAVAAILVAVLFGVIFSNLNPTNPTVGFATPVPSPSGSFVIGPSFSPGPSAPVAATTTPVPTPALPGTITFGTVLDGATRTVSQPTDQFTPQAGAFAHSIAFRRRTGRQCSSRRWHGSPATGARRSSRAGTRVEQRGSECIGHRLQRAGVGCLPGMGHRAIS